MKRILPTLLKFLLALVMVLILGQFIFEKIYSLPSQIIYGVTFSPRFAQDLGLDWKETYIKILDDLKVRKLRLPTYWDIIESQEANYDFSQTDFMLDQAYKRGAQVILVLGVRQPRWPECHIPDWAQTLSSNKQQSKILMFIGKVVDRYAHHPAVWAWQVENEPLLKYFGKCEEPDIPFLKSEVDWVRKLSNKPIIVSDSGELGLWIIPMQVSDIFGTTLYRTVYNSILGFTNYPILPYLYNVKSSLIRSFFAPESKKTIIIELQAEPWSPINNLVSTPIDKQLALFSLKTFKDNLSYAQKTGFDEAYLWGVEWWYWMSGKGHPEYLDYAQSLFNK